MKWLELAVFQKNWIRKVDSFSGVGIMSWAELWSKEKKLQRAEKEELSLFIIAIVYFKCKAYSFELIIVLSVKPKPK